MALKAEQKKFLLDSSKLYRESLPGSPAEEHLAERGLLDAAVPFGLGYVDEPAVGHEMYRGMLAIPYIRRAVSSSNTVVSIRFRCIEPGCDHKRHPGGKYITMAGDKPRMFNTMALMGPHDWVAVSEGELDAIQAHSIGIPTVGIPGASMWQESWAPPFEGYKHVYVIADGDDAGMKFAERVAKELKNAVVITCPQGEDINSLVQSQGPDALLAKVKGTK